MSLRSSVSVSAWVKNQGSPGVYRYIVAKGGTGCIAASYGLYSGPNGGLQFYVSNGRGTTYTRSPDAGTGVWDGNWHMVVGTYDGSTVREFVDGREIGNGVPHSGPLEYLLPDSNNFYIGGYPGCALPFVGTIDEVNVWSRALSAADVQALFDQADQVPVGGSPPRSPRRRRDRAGPEGPAAGGAQGGQGGAPSIRGLTVSPSAFTLASRHVRRSSGRRIGATVSYTDTQAATSSFTVLVRRVGVKVRRRCLTPAPRRRGPRPATCVTYVRIGGFTRIDRAGRNSFRLTGVGGRKLAPGKYRLQAIPKAHGQIGKTITATFTVTLLDPGPPRKTSSRRPG